MKKNTSKTAFLIALMIMSLASFTYVNIAPRDKTVNVTKVEMKDTRIEENDEVKDSKLPDLKFIKHILNIVEKFLPAK
jgi:hypothetical protein